MTRSLTQAFNGAIARVRRARRVFILQFFGNLALAGGMIVWFLIPVSRVWHIIVAALLAAVLIAFTVWLHAVTAACVQRQSQALRIASGQVLAFALWLVLLCVVLWELNNLFGQDIAISTYTRSRLPQGVRAWISQSTADKSFYVLFLLVSWAVVVIILTFAMRSAVYTFRSELWRSVAHILKHSAYWWGMLILAVVGIGAPRLILTWKPGTTVAVQMVSLIIRLLIAYSVAITAWLLSIGLVSTVAADSKSS